MIVEVKQEKAYEIIEKISSFIVSRKMGAAAILVIESLRPLNYIGSQLMYFLAPFAEVIFNPKEYQELAALIENREYVKLLIDRIDEMDEEMYREERKNRRILRKRRINKFKKMFKKK